MKAGGATWLNGTHFILGICLGLWQMAPFLLLEQRSRVWITRRGTAKPGRDRLAKRTSENDTISTTSAIHCHSQRSCVSTIFTLPAEQSYMRMRDRLQYLLYTDTLYLRFTGFPSQYVSLSVSELHFFFHIWHVSCIKASLTKQNVWQLTWSLIHFWALGQIGTNPGFGLTLYFLYIFMFIFGLTIGWNSSTFWGETKHGLIWELSND